jgi:hypothetical protein
MRAQHTRVRAREHSIATCGSKRRIPTTHTHAYFDFDFDNLLGTF